MTTLIEIRNLIKRYPFQNRQMTAVQDLSLTIRKGEILGLAGESGCGKSTVGRCLLQLTQATSGSIHFDGQILNKMTPCLRKRMQMIFQDPYSSLNPMMTIEDIVGEPFAIHKICNGEERRNRVLQLLNQVGLEPNALQRYPHEFSGGQRQRIGIARAIALEPEFLVCDEPISALDATIQKQIVALMRALQREKGLTYLWISHDLAVMESLADRIAVMYLGRLMELGPARQLFQNPLHPYTQALSSAIPIPDPKIEKTRLKLVLQGDIPSPANPPTGCVFHTRCPMAMPICKTNVPQLKEREPGSGRFTACHL